MSSRYTVAARKHSGTIELGSLGVEARVAYAGQNQTVPGRQAGASLWSLMRKGGVHPQSVNTFAVFEGDEDGAAIAYLHAVLEGARVVWLILYRADRAASAFKSIGTRQRVGDALDACFERVIEDIKLPHKP